MEEGDELLSLFFTKKARRTRQSVGETLERESSTM